MECQSSDSKKLFKVFDASKRKKTRKKRDGLDDTNSVATDESVSICQPAGPASAKTSLQEMSIAPTLTGTQDASLSKRGSSPSVTRSHRNSRSPRRHHRSTREGVSLALKAGMVSTPRSDSPDPHQDKEGAAESIPQDQDSFIYAFLEEAIKRDKKKQRHSRRREERRVSDEREISAPRERHRHRRHRDEARSGDDARGRDKPRSKDEARCRDETRSRDDARGREEPRSRDEARCRGESRSRDDTRCRDELRSRDEARNREEARSRDDARCRDKARSRDREREREKRQKEVPPTTGIDQTMLFETFAKICAQLNEKSLPYHPNAVPRTLSHKSLQCEVDPRRDPYDIDRHPIRLRSNSKIRENPLTKLRSSENFRKCHENDERLRAEKCMCYYEKDDLKYPSKLDVCRSRRHMEDERYRDFPSIETPTRSYIDPYRRPPENRDYREYEREKLRQYEEDRRRYLGQKTSRSFDINREPYVEERFRRTARSDNINKDIKRYDDRDTRERFESKYYDDKPIERDRINNIPNKDRRWKKNEKFERNSVVSREDDYRERDRYSEKERDSGLSVADGETSTVSARSTCLKVVKQEIAEQREAMDKMMKLWKELMRCFKGISQTQTSDKNVRETTANVRESAAAQLRLWRECMHRYETVARDVGDTDARLMEEIKKQRSEMAEMANMWQECLQRYRDISNDFNNLKQQVLVPPESPQRAPAPAPPVCSEGEGAGHAAPYRLPPHFPPMGQIPSGYSAYAGSPLRGRASAPPAWMWCEPPRSPRRRSSPDSRASRERERRHRHKDRDDLRHKEKSKPNAARSEHKHRKR